MLRIMVNMLSQIAKFLLFMLIMFVILSLSGQFLFDRVEVYQKFSTSFFSMFDTAFGNYDMEIYTIDIYDEN